ncbi:MAG TPA: DUF3750 domain-containing protein [Armatimonadaceae bacterium]|nr:DUF3750 domain-containing protein [Armatimonadaceae bacterium]
MAASPRPDAPDDAEGESRVELWAAPLPQPLSPFAWHGWFVVREGESAARYEVWQRRDVGGTSAGHVHRDLMRAQGGVGGGAARRIFTFTGPAAERLAGVLARALETYPNRDRYVYWPGPNSNTFVRWALDEAGLWDDVLLDPRLVGKDYLGRFGVGMRRAPGVFQFASPLVSLRAGGRAGVVELSALGITVVGFARSPRLLLTPAGFVRLRGEK